MSQMNKLKGFSFGSLLITAMFTWYIMPVARVYIRDLPAMIFGMIICIVFSMQNEHCAKFFIGSSLISFALSLDISLITYGGSFQPFYSQFIHLSLFFCIPTVMSIYVVEKMRYCEIRVLSNIFYVILGIVFISSFIVLLQNPYAARELASSSAPEEVIQLWRHKNVGGYSLTYALAIVFIFLVYKIRKDTTNYKPLIVIIIIFSIFYFIMAQYVTLLLILSTSVLISFLARKSIRKSIFLACIILCLLLLFKGILVFLFDFLAHATESPIISRRLLELSVFLKSGTTGISLQARLNCYLSGIEWFLKSPIWGNSAISYGSIDIWHSTVIEYMVKVGIVGFALYCSLFVQAVRYSFRRLTHTSIIKLAMPALVYVILTGVFDPIHSSHEIAILLFLFIPVLIKREDNSYGKMGN